MSYEPSLMIIEYREGRPSRTWNGIAACAQAHHIHQNTLKSMIATGAPLYTDASVTFDLDAECPYHYELQPDSHGRMRPRLITDTRKKTGGDKWTT